MKLELTHPKNVIDVYRCLQYRLSGRELYPSSVGDIGIKDFGQIPILVNRHTIGRSTAAVMGDIQNLVVAYGVPDHDTDTKRFEVLGDNITPELIERVRLALDGQH